MAITINREELAWAAGFFDGEGHVHFQMRRNGNPTDTHRWRRIQIQVNQCHPEVLERFQKAVGGIGVIGGPYGPYSSGPNKRAHWKYGADGFAKSQAVIAMLWPFLGSVKKEQAAKCLRTWHSNPKEDDSLG